MSNTIVLFVPTESDVANLKVGDKALDCWGRWSEVTEVTYRGKDVDGVPFVCFYTRTGPSSGISGTYKAGRLQRHVGLLGATSAKLDAVERAMNKDDWRLLETGASSAEDVLRLFGL